MKKMNLKKLACLIAVIFVISISYVIIPSIDFSNDSNFFEINQKETEGHENAHVIDYGSFEKVNFSYPTKIINTNGINISNVSFVAFPHQYTNTEFYNCKDGKSYIGKSPIKFGVVDIDIEGETLSFCRHIIEKNIDSQEVQNNYVYALPYDNGRAATLSFTAKYKPCDLDICEDIIQDDIDTFVKEAVESLGSKR